MPKQIFISTDAYVVRGGGGIIAESKNVKILAESGHDDRVFFPKSDIAMVLFDLSPTVAVDARLGSAQYYHLAGQAGQIDDVAWSYLGEGLAAEIAEHVTFDPQKVAIERL